MILIIALIYQALYLISSIFQILIGIFQIRIIQTQPTHHFYRALTINSIQQFVFSPTRNNNILDLIFFNTKLFISKVCINEPFGSLNHTSDLCSLSFYVNCLTLSPRNAFYFDYNKTDISSLALFFRDTDFLSSSDDSFDNSLILVNRFINELIIKYVPMTKFVSHKNRLSKL